ncbi:MAG: endopeptidase La [Planctomycetota bacterium]
MAKKAAKKPAEKTASKAGARKQANKPASKKPAAKKRTTEKPAGKPAARKPAAEKPAAKKPAAKKPAAKKPAAKKPAAKKSAAKKSAAKKPPAKKSAAKKSAAKKPPAKKSAAKKPGAKKVSSKKPTAKRAPAKKKRVAPARGKRKAAATATPDLPEDAIPILAARGMILFPGVVLPVLVGRERSVRAVQEALRLERPIGIVLQRDPEAEAPPPEELHAIGTTAQIVRYLTAPDGSHHVIAQGEERFRVRDFVQTEPYLAARVEGIPETEYDELPKDIEALFVTLKQQAHEVLDLLPQKPEDLDTAVENADAPAGLTDLIATFMDVPVDEKQEILETLELKERMHRVAEKLGHMGDVLKLSSEIRERTQGQLEKSQREYFLREQLRTIEKELGEGPAPELQELAKAIEKARMPRTVKKEARRELARLQRMPEAAAEHGMLRNYLETLTELPWAKSTKDSIDLDRARKILEEDHHGLDKVKRRILEFLAVRKLKPDGKSPILCFVGPPGVGKTSLGRSIARATNRKYARLSLGGVHDEAEIRGHRRTYVGAMPGNVIQNLKKAGANNPVFVLDEMDKLGRSFHGDPSSALLEVLDPEQNREFTDHYLNVPFDLSRVMFVGTANVLDSIPGPLRDRCEVIEISGYTEEEKLSIATRYLVRRTREHAGLTEEQLSISEDALRTIVRSYTREAGVRNLEREIGAVARFAATKVASGESEAVQVGADDLHTILGPTRFENEVALRTSVPGVATGLAWTPVGGDVLFVEATRMPGRGELILTGQLGDVMKESARAALTLIQSRLNVLGVASSAMREHDLHIHVPAGAIPKDGPSAGVAMFLAIASLLTGTTVASDLAVTGEISLRGLVLPVGGIKEKVLAAHHAGIRTVMLPARNKKDFEEIPEEAREQLHFVWLENVEQALDHGLGIPAAGSVAEERSGPRTKLSARRGE